MVIFEFGFSGHDYMVQLMTFHGKIVLEDQITVDVTSKKVRVKFYFIEVH